VPTITDNPFTTIEETSKEHFPKCPKCSKKDQVVVDYGSVDDDQNLPEEVKFYHQVPFSCWNCGYDWFGLFIDT